MQVKIGSLVKFYALLLLSEGPKHGYTLMKELENRFGKKISASQVYPFLNILKKNKLIQVLKKSERDKKVYSLTRKGSLFLSSFLQRFGNLLHASISAKIISCSHCGCKIYEGSYKETLNGKELVFCCKHCAKSF